MASTQTQKKKRPLFLRIMIFIFLAGIVAFLLTAAINGYVILSTKGKIITIEQAADLNADCILVLGSGLKRDGTPSDMLTDRLLVGLDAYEAHAAQKLLMSGDHGREKYDEVNAMKAFAIERGVPSTDVFMDHAGFSTYESMYRARDIFEVKKVLIVTQGYHLYRAIYDAERLGLEAYGMVSDLNRYRRQRFYDVREYLARIKDFAYGIIKPEPTYLGEVISVFGDGDLTND